MGTPIDIEKLRSVGVIGRRTAPVVREFKREDGVKCKATTDELGNTVTEHAKGDRQDVLISAPRVNVDIRTSEERQ